MTWRYYVNTVIISFPLLFTSCGGDKIETHSEEQEPEKIEQVSYDVTESANHYADSVMSKMTLEEMAGQCLMPAIYTNTTQANLELYRTYIEDYHVGGIVLFQGDLESAKILGMMAKDSDIPLFVAIDAEWGLGMRLKDAPVYPKNGNLAPKEGEKDLFDYGRKIASECREAGINMVLGPVVDVTSRKGGVIGIRSFGSDPVMVSDFGVAYSKGVESGGVISVAKHFPGHGSAWNDSHLGVAVTTRQISDLDSLDLLPFKEYINSGLSGIMAGHIQAPALDPGGAAASVSMDMLTSLLREEMHFKGLIMTDSFIMGGAKGFSAVEALRAGADLVLCPVDVKKEYEGIVRALENKELSVRVIKDRSHRILFYKYLFIAN